MYCIFGCKILYDLQHEVEEVTFVWEQMANSEKFGNFSGFGAPEFHQQILKTIACCKAPQPNDVARTVTRSGCAVDEICDHKK